MSNMTPCLWFENQALEAATFYTSVFPKSKLGHVLYAGPVVKGQPKPPIVTVAFTINGADFVALNGNTTSKPNPSMSIVVNCRTQKEIDTYWTRLLADGGEESR